jgi:SAM-dependent methyltransferase
MAGDPMPTPAWHTMTDEQARRWVEVLDNLTDVIPPRASVLVDGADGHTRVVADRLAATLHATGQPCARLTDTTPLADEDAWRVDQAADSVTLAEGPRWRVHPPTGRWDVVIWLRTRSSARTQPTDRPAGGDRGGHADIVVDLHDPTWPVIRHITPRLADHGRWYVRESRAFFAARADTWDTKFGADLPTYATAVTDAKLPPGGVVIDVGCGTGRALPALRNAVGPEGVVIGLDLTPQMLGVAQRHGRAQHAHLVVADARQLPLPDASVDAVFAAGLIMHLPDTDAGLHQLARVTRPGGRLVLFHPSGRAALAARHGRTLRDDEPLSEAPLRRSTDHTGWRLTSYDDPPHRFLAIATRR